jgi:hypothetical protein
MLPLQSRIRVSSGCLLHDHDDAELSEHSPFTSVLVPLLRPTSGTWPSGKTPKRRGGFIGAQRWSKQPTASDLGYRHCVEVETNAGLTGWRDACGYTWPSVIKVGGITEYLNVVAPADAMNVKLAPHSPYFGPGPLATLQLMSLLDDANRKAGLRHGEIDIDSSGAIALPDGLGLRA